MSLNGPQPTTAPGLKLLDISRDAILLRGCRLDGVTGFKGRRAEGRNRCRDRKNTNNNAGFYKCSVHKRTPAKP
jgi:hypothetical protein